ncbi:hypothetical protein LP417_35780 (plasmid) [Polaromonas sp. P1-6]|nr:hypothetical protein LP417_35780 [Polaromonas sp. P1-6]
MTSSPRRPTLDEIHASRQRIAPFARRTPLVELDLGLPDRRIYLKLETLQPIGAFKIRPALNAVLSRDPRDSAAWCCDGQLRQHGLWHGLGRPRRGYSHGRVHVRGRAADED